MFPGWHNSMLKLALSVRCTSLWHLLAINLTIERDIRYGQPFSLDSLHYSIHPVIHVWIQDTSTSLHFTVYGISTKSPTHWCPAQKENLGHIYLTSWNRNLQSKRRSTVTLFSLICKPCLRLHVLWVTPRYFVSYQLSQKLNQSLLTNQPYSL